MKLKNNGNSVISIGKTAILPDETANITAKEYQDNDAVNFLIQRGTLSEVTERAKAKTPKTDAAKAKGKAEPAADTTTETNQQ